MEKVKVKLTRGFYGKDRKVHQVGDIISVSRERAEALINIRRATLYVAPEPAKKATSK